ncbi:phosphatase PAP2 family protein [Clostridiisalibacter paucivorans]|uniref:phosphatase PAP2 family protein n=1 Tax=Clostridiisalibacter paucivorans TaxID=408753 RepID=UPI000479FC4A|nr:phosphatase PAP2 family protein [Clostridiisalibacter paucivorans]
MSKIKNNKNKIIVFLALVILNMLYLWTNRLNMQIHLTELFIDKHIPLVKYMIIPYFFWYIYVWMVFFYLAVKDEKLFFTHSKATIISKSICIILFLVYPTFVIRPEITGQDIFSKALIHLYASDNPVNALPSIHVLQTILTHIAIINIRNATKKLKISSSIISMLIILSTVMTKQHNIIDVFAAYILAIIVIKIVYLLDYKKCKLSIVEDVVINR